MKKIQMVAPHPWESDSLDNSGAKPSFKTTHLEDMITCISSGKPPDRLVLFPSEQILKTLGWKRTQDETVSQLLVSSVCTENHITCHPKKIVF